MKTQKIIEALAVLGDNVDAKLADEALAELRALEAERGATLRDTLAAAALTALLSRGWGLTDSTACTVYEMADAMLAARERK